MDDAALGVTREERWLADALAGSPDALGRFAAHDVDGALARRHRAGAALRLRAERHGLAAPAPWHRELVATAAHHLGLEAAVDEIGERLAASGIEWLPFKGFDLAARVYDAPEERPTADVDLLIPAARLGEARRALEDDGWEGLFTGPRNRDFLVEEGYAWLARKPGRGLLELHFRLWGLVPEAWAEDVFARSWRDPALPPGGRRLTLADAYLTAAVHAWLDPPPRPVTAWWDLDRISKHWPPEEAEDAVAGARAWDLQLPVALASRISAGLWGSGGCRRIAERLETDLRFAERVVAARACRKGLATLPLSRLQTARLLAGRRSRQGWRGAWRRLWAHPGIVERATPEAWPWPLRRLAYQLRPLARGPRP
jgi:hypothetical protein